MLTRVYIDNYRCFDRFQYNPARLQLILGGNGTGKTTLVEVLCKLRAFAVAGDKEADEIFPSGCWTEWLSRPQQTFEIEASIEGGVYIYKLVIERSGEPLKSRVAEEALFFNGKRLLHFSENTIVLYNDRPDSGSYAADSQRSALPVMEAKKENRRLTVFKEWLEKDLYAIRINPYSMHSLAERDVNHPDADLSNFAGWYKRLREEQPQRKPLMFADLEQVLDGFESLVFSRGKLEVEFRIDPRPDNQSIAHVFSFALEELSEGQRVLIALYVILHYVLRPGITVLIDEPENFVALRELQPWLMAMMDRAEETGAQVLLISHHPELINQWAPNFGVQFVRDRVGPVRVEEFRGVPESPLSPAELVARGWERE